MVRIAVGLLHRLRHLQVDVDVDKAGLYHDVSGSIVQKLCNLCDGGRQWGVHLVVRHVKDPAFSGVSKRDDCNTIQVFQTPSASQCTIVSGPFLVIQSSPTLLRGRAYVARSCAPGPRGRGREPAPCAQEI